MKQTAYALGGLIALGVVAFLGWSIFRGQSLVAEPTQQEPGVVVAAQEDLAAVSGEAPAVPQTVQEKATSIPPTEVPAPDDEADTDAEMEEAMQEAEIAVDQAMPAPVPPMGGFGGAMDMAYGPYGPWAEDATLTLNASLPTEPTSAVVYSQENIHNGFRPPTIAPEEARAIADKYGFTGPLFTEFYPGMPQEEAQYMPYTSMMNGYEIMMHADFVNINKVSTEQMYGPPQMNGLDFEVAKSAAIDYLAQFGMPDFDYEVRQGWGSEVQILRKVDGYTFDQPAINVTINEDGELQYMNFQRHFAPVEVQSLDLRSAESAWADLQERFGSSEEIFFNYFENPERFMNQEIYGPQGFWERNPLSELGENELVSWPRMLRNSETGELTIFINGVRLNTDQATIEEIASSPIDQLRVWGTLREENGERVLDLEGWENLVMQGGDISLTGVIERDGMRVDGGLFVKMPDLPEDVTEGMRVYVYGRGISHTDGSTDAPVFDWLHMNEHYGMEEPPMMEPGMEEMYSPANSIEITSVTLGYHMSWPGEMLPGFPEMDLDVDRDASLLIPVWQFSGTADNGDRFEFWMPAVAK